MANKLVIVESPSKAKSIGTYLGPDYEVISSKGHIRDLSTRGKGGLGVDVDNNFKPDYIAIKGKSSVIKEIKQKAKNKQVLLATDPDREGEAIAWHIADILGLDLNENNRVVFKEITKSNVINQINNSRKLDMNIVRSQETRRIADRIIGFKLSAIVKRKLSARSAGRVQSVALRLICDQEKLRDKFIPEKYFDIKLEGKNFLANYIKKDSKKLVTSDEKDLVEKQATPLYEVESINKRDRISKPKKPFITSTIQQAAFSKFGYSSNYTMSICQKLYEGVEIDNEVTGLITYMRTDSTRLSNDFVKVASDYITSNFGGEYLGKEYSFKNKQLSQDAHEAIRPTNILNTPDKMAKYLESGQLKIYKMIYERSLSCLMSDSVSEVTEVILSKNSHKFLLEGVKEKFLGYTLVEKVNINKEIPDFKVGDKVDGKLIIEEKQTLPPARYNEASLIKELESRGIGRPSTGNIWIN